MTWTKYSETQQIWNSLLATCFFCWLPWKQNQHHIIRGESTLSSTDTRPQNDHFTCKFLLTGYLSAEAQSSTPCSSSPPLIASKIVNIIIESGFRKFSLQKVCFSENCRSEKRWLYDTRPACPKNQRSTNHTSKVNKIFTFSKFLPSFRHH